MKKNTRQRTGRSRGKKIRSVRQEMRRLKEKERKR